MVEILDLIKVTNSRICKTIEIARYTMYPYIQSGLTAACRSSTTSLTQAEETMLTFVQDHTHKGACPLAGNTVHMDKRFLDKYMPRFSGHLHYRIIDVSSVKELCK